MGTEAPPPEEPAPVEIPIEDTFDLHVFHPSEVRAATTAYLDAAADKGLTEVRLIHGRGIGQQREAVRAICRKHPRVTAYQDAPPERGGWGATVAYLDPRPRPSASRND